MMYVRSVKQYSEFKKILLNLQKQIPLGEKIWFYLNIAIWTIFQTMY